MSGIMSLPDSWILTNIDEICDFHAGFGFPTEMQGVAGNALPFYKVKDVSVAWHAHSSLLLETEHSLSHADADRIKAKPTPEGAVVFAKIGEALRLNRRAVVPRPSLIDNNLMGISAPPTRLANRYLYWFSTATKFDVDARASVVPSIRKSDVGNLPFPLPPLAEQTRIVAKLEELLSDLDAGVAELKAAQKKLGQYRQSLLKAAVEGALTAEWRAAQGRASVAGGRTPEATAQHTPTETGAQLLERILTERRARWEAKQLAKFKEQGKTPPKDWQNKYPEPVQPDTTDLPALPEGWVWASLGQLLAELTSGSRDWAPYYDRGSSIFVMAQNVRPWRPDFAFKQLVDPPVDHRDRVRSEICLDDLLTTIVGANTGQVCRVAEPIFSHFVCQSVALMRLVSPSMSEFVNAVLNSEGHGQRQFREMNYGAGRPHLSFDQLESVLVPLPPPEEQVQVVNVVADTLRACERVEAEVLTLLKQSTAQRQNILRAAFAGQLVPQDPNDEPASVLLERIRTERAERDAVKKPRGRKVKEASL